MLGDNKPFYPRHRRVQILVAEGHNKFLNYETYFFFSHEKTFIFYVTKFTMVGVFFNHDQKV